MERGRRRERWMGEGRRGDLYRQGGRYKSSMIDIELSGIISGKMGQSTAMLWCIRYPVSEDIYRSVPPGFQAPTVSSK